MPMAAAIDRVDQCVFCPAVARAGAIAYRAAGRTPDRGAPMVVVVQAVPWWDVVSSAAALVLLAGRWTVAAGALLGLLVWFAAELVTRGGQVGLAERVLTEAQAVWPLAVVLTCWRSVSSARVPPWAPAR